MAKPGQLSVREARELIRKIEATGRIRPTGHFWDEARADGITLGKAKHVLREGIVGPAYLREGEWRYKVTRHAITLVVAFDSEQQLCMVTTWKN